MSASRLRATVQLTSVLLALLGFWFLLLGIGKLINGKWWGVITLLFWAYSVYVGYLAVMRFSPKAIRHCAILTCFWLFGLLEILIWKIQIGEQSSSSIKGLLLIVLIVGLVWLYRRTVPYLAQRIFPPVQPPKIDSQ